MYNEGRYRVKITGQALTENKKGNPEVQLTILPVGWYEPQSDKPEPYAFQFPRTIFLTLTDATIGDEKAPGWVLHTLHYLGFRGTSFAALDPNVDGAFVFVGMELDATCRHDTYEGKTREKWAILRSGEARATKAIEKKAIRQLDSRFSKVLKSMAAKPAPAGAVDPAGEAELAAETPADATPAASDIPF